MYFCAKLVIKFTALQIHKLKSSKTVPQLARNDRLHCAVALAVQMPTITMDMGVWQWSCECVWDSLFGGELLVSRFIDLPKGRNKRIEWLKKSKILPNFDLDCDCQSLLSDWRIGALGLDCQSNPCFLGKIRKNKNLNVKVSAILINRIAANDLSNW